MAVAAITGINASIDDLTVVYPGENLWYSMISESVASSHLINDTVRVWAVSSNPKILSYSWLVFTKGLSSVEEPDIWIRSLDEQTS